MNTVDNSMDPTQRLALTRARLALALRSQAKPANPGAAAGAGAATSSLLDSLQAIPGGAIVLDILKTWWAQHPLRVTTAVLSDAAQVLLRPMAQRHPLGLVAVAFVVGGLLVWKRPWRWIVTPALVAGLLPQLLAKVVAQVSQRNWLDVLNALAKSASAPAAASSAAPAPTGTGPSAPD
jgi:inactivated superfamily I helicase